MFAAILKWNRFDKVFGITLGKIAPPKVRKPRSHVGFEPGEQREHLDRLVTRRRKELLGV